MANRRKRLTYLVIHGKRGVTFRMTALCQRKMLDFASVVHQPFYVLICISILPTTAYAVFQHFLCSLSTLSMQHTISIVLLWQFTSLVFTSMRRFYTAKGQHENCFQMNSNHLHECLLLLNETRDL